MTILQDRRQIAELTLQKMSYIIGLRKSNSMLDDMLDILPYNLLLKPRKSANPCTNINYFACSEWLKRHPQSTQSQWAQPKTVTPRQCAPT